MKKIIGIIVLLGIVGFGGKEQWKKIQPVPQDAKVTLYAKSDDSLCDEVRQTLDRARIPYEEKLLDDNRTLRRKVYRRARNEGLTPGAPLVDVNGKLLYNPNIDEIREYLFLPASTFEGGATSTERSETQWD